MSPGFSYRRVSTAAKSGFGVVRLAPHCREALDALPEAGLRAERLSLERLAELYGKLNADRPPGCFRPAAGRHTLKPLAPLWRLFRH
jgi:hypothetical protein